MTWTPKLEKPTSGPAAGITFWGYDRIGDQVRGEASIGETKVLVNGTASLLFALDQRKYGDELIAQVFTNGNDEIRPRVSARYDRIQVYLGTIDVPMVRVLRFLADEAERRITRRLKP